MFVTCGQGQSKVPLGARATAGINGFGADALAAIGSLEGGHPSVRGCGGIHAGHVEEAVHGRVLPLDELDRKSSPLCDQGVLDGGLAGRAAQLAYSCGDG